MDLPSIDLNLLVALQALLEERNVTRAGESIGLSQPATSAALGRLRRHFGDELLVREGQQYVLTPLATSLLDQAQIALRFVGDTFAARPHFEPATSGREFRAVMSDYSLTVLGGPVLRLMEQRAPGVRLRIRAMDRMSVDDADMTLRSADLMILPRGYLNDLPSAELYRDRWVCAVAADNTVVDDPVVAGTGWDTLTLGALGRLRWLVTWDQPTQFTPADKHLKLAGIERRIDAVVESFVALPFLLAGTQRACLLQARLARKLQASADVRILELPTPPPELVEAMWWHPSRTADPGHHWLQDLFQEAAATSCRTAVRAGY